MFQFMEIFGEVMRIVTFQRQSENPSQLHEEGNPSHRRVSRPDRCTAPFRR
ncbi:hypothetical protein LGH82_01585 [Mesorhizobium sp. PAMC28654]|uniref:hypothetical protein n=1 Tax=Mesorhizobium sp. PAMC28654 TaxID=2880934 RepID=UPI001D09E79C|nr:hypothetical protein [Mesorhizobium sp. PAMC28654]UDL90119.1 hypothetical protein LGH82_01585 [Mesorhizobium sp. PAMC28654]